MNKATYFIFSLIRWCASQVQFLFAMSYFDWPITPLPPTPQEEKKEEKKPTSSKRTSLSK